jgi:hypothetical protein
MELLHLHPGGFIYFSAMNSTGNHFPPQGNKWWHAETVIF